MKIVKTIIRYLSVLTSWLFWEFDDEVRDEYEGYDKEQHMED